MRVCIVGLGYIGLPTALVLADHGVDVIGVDNNQQRLDHIRHATIQMHEKDFHQRLNNVLQSKRLTLQLFPSVADVFIICVPTPFKDTNKADLSYVWQAFIGILEYVTKGCCIIIESTIPVGTTQLLSEYIHQHTSYRVGKDIYMAYCPERVLPGTVFDELINNKRVIGGMSQACAQRAYDFYKIFVHADCIQCSAKEAEMVKLIENSYRDVNLAFSHQLAHMAEHAQLDPYKIIELANHHPRVSILTPSAGVGGHCIAVDPWFLIETFPEQSTLLSQARAINDQRPLMIVDRVLQYAHAWYATYNKPLELIIFGLTYKPDVDDIRQSPALLIAKKLTQSKLLKIRLCDPYVPESSLSITNPDCVTLASDMSTADALLFLVNHTCFMKLHGLISPHQMIFDYCGVGISPTNMTMPHYLAESVTL